MGELVDLTTFAKFGAQVIDESQPDRPGLLTTLAPQVGDGPVARAAYDDVIACW